MPGRVVRVRADQIFAPGRLSSTRLTVLS